jgi:hypothetical protein
MAEEDHAAQGWHRLSLVVGHEPQALQIAAAAAVAERRERLGSRLEAAWKLLGSRWLLS